MIITRDTIPEHPKQAIDFAVTNMLKQYRVFGRSMLPTLEHGQEGYYVPVPFHKLKIGDIVIFANKRNYTTIHRIVGRKGPFWITKGDNNKREDRQLLSHINYIGKVI